MTHAIDALRMKRMGLKKACREYNVPRTTLQRRYKSSCDNETAASKGLGSKKKVFDAKHGRRTGESRQSNGKYVVWVYPKAFQTACLSISRGK